MEKRTGIKQTVREEALKLLRALLCAYVVTGVLLVVLTLLLYKTGISEENVNAGILLIYVVSHVFRRLCDRKAERREEVPVGAADRGPVFRLTAADLVWRLPYAAGGGRRNGGGIRALRGRWDAWGYDLVKKCFENCRGCGIILRVKVCRRTGGQEYETHQDIKYTDFKQYSEKRRMR